MSAMKTGLRHRLRRAVRQIGKQHEHLRSAHRAVAAAVAAADVAELEACMDRLSGAIEAHFALEESVFFPALHGLHPESAPELQELVREHEAHRADLERLRSLLTDASLADFAGGYGEFAASTAEHEGREERLLAALSHLFDGGD